MSKSAILKKQITDLITEKVHLRDDWHRLYAILCAQAIKASKPEQLNLPATIALQDASTIDWDKMTAHQYISEIARGYDSVLPEPASVRRLWQKIQQDNKELRGNNWHKRHGISQQKKRVEMRSDEFTKPQTQNNATSTPTPNP